MKTIAASKFRAQFTELLRDLSTGPVEVTKHGKVIAILTSTDSPVEAIEEPETTTDPSEATEPVTSPSEPLEDMSEEDEFQALLSGDMSWEEAHEISPGAPLTVIEITEEEAENGDWLDDMETDDGEE